MSKTDISQEHKTSKKNSYWDNLTGGNTAAYKEKVMEALIKSYAPQNAQSLLDIGCGTCELIFKYKKDFGSRRAVCMDYDAKVIDILRQKYGEKNAEWVVQDVFGLENWKSEKFDLIFLLDMVHEVYSFYGRPSKDTNIPIDHAKGVQIVLELLRNVATVTNPSGCIVITDNIVCEENLQIQIRLKNDETIEALNYFFEHYPTKKFKFQWISKNVLEMNSRDFCTVLTQYNKVKGKNWDRWNVERLETHQYFTLTEYKNAFEKLGFELHAVVGTPEDAQMEWNDDFEILSGLKALPEKRITLLAKKK